MNLAWIITEHGMRWMERGIQPEDFIGFVSLMLNPESADGAVKQLDAGYQHGGGWRPMEGFTLGEGYTLRYPGDPDLSPLAWALMSEKEIVVVYPHAIFLVAQLDPETSKVISFEAARMD